MTKACTSVKNRVSVRRSAGAEALPEAHGFVDFSLRTAPSTANVP